MVNRVKITHRSGIDNLVQIRKHSNKKHCASNMYELNPVWGCEFQCQYCGVYSLETEYFNELIIYDDFLDYFEGYIYANKKELQDKYFYFSAKVDCFQETIVNNGLVLSLLKLLRKYNLRYFIVTKGKLPPEDIQQELIRAREINQVIISNAMPDEDTRRRLEPFAATIDERMTLARFCLENGITTTGSCSPIFPINEEQYILPVIERFMSVGVDQFFLHFFDGTKHTFARIMELMPDFRRDIEKYYFRDDVDFNDWNLWYKNVDLKKYLPPSSYMFESFDRIKTAVGEMNPNATVSVCSAPFSTHDQAVTFNQEAHNRGYHCVGTRFELCNKNDFFKDNLWVPPKGARLAKSPIRLRG